MRGVLVNMRYNLGWTRLAQFRRFLAACESGLWKIAAAEMRDSAWYVQVGERAERLAAKVEGLAT